MKPLVCDVCGKYSLPMYGFPVEYDIFHICNVCVEEKEQ
jgi:hypothetical protein